MQRLIRSDFKSIKLEKIQGEKIKSLAQMWAELIWVGFEIPGPSSIPKKLIKLKCTNS